ncbi:MAG TPA: LemA family protein [Bacilli bacterium]|nr:MAG: LemA family protein [Tenericutes bacterium ADurb.BinA124]HNZ50047.1 LemA family protein [Bacilli bacterium]HPX84181.1 LemA family protein [Bacilli bacterium]HQC74227.1 LemA family protein [Bacilli bacterium]
MNNLFLISVGGIVGIVIALVVVLLIVFVISIYNKLVVLRNRVRNGWSQIDVQLKRRFDLIPNLVETAKGYANLEKGIFEEFAKARGLYAQAAQAGNVEGMAQANQSLGGTLSRLLMVQEQYPELKANTNFQDLMAQLKDTEDKISFNRQFYNDTVLGYNNKIELFPSNIIANIFRFQAAQFFEVKDEAQREAPKVKF